MHAYKEFDVVYLLFVHIHLKIKAKLSLTKLKQNLWKWNKVKL